MTFFSKISRFRSTLILLVTFRNNGADSKIGHQHIKLVTNVRSSTFVTNIDAASESLTRENCLRVLNLTLFSRYAQLQITVSQPLNAEAVRVEPEDVGEIQFKLIHSLMLANIAEISYFRSNFRSEIWLTRCVNPNFITVQSCNFFFICFF